MKVVVSGRGSDVVSADDYLWTAGFFNERFPDVVSPLGWSIVGSLVERSALHEPLEFIGYRLPPDYPLTKAQGGRIYTNVGVFQRLYRMFPASLVPSDAARYFPHGDLALRLAVAPPPPARMIASILRTLLTEPGWHPWNYRTWERFVPDFEAHVAAARLRIELTAEPERLLHEVGQLMQASLSLLRLHRWSLTYADVVYGVLQRLVSEWVGTQIAHDLSAILVSGLENRSTATDQALWHLADHVLRLGAGRRACLQVCDFDAFVAGFGESDSERAFSRALDEFLSEYGHRSPSLDIRYPAYTDDPSEVLALITRLAETSADPAERLAKQRERRKAAWREVAHTLRASPLRWRLLSVVVHLAQRYTVLREDQRFYWQKSMSAKRLALVKIGVSLSRHGAVRAPDDIFYLTLREITGLVRGWLPSEAMRTLIGQREAEATGDEPYPPLLVGQTPLATGQPEPAGLTGETSFGEILDQSAYTSSTPPFPEVKTSHAAAPVLIGLGASPGRAQGRAVVVGGPAALPHVVHRLATHPTGDQAILVASATDPAWTPLFLRVAGLVLERGGQLSHGAVVAREYGLPAVVGVKGALEHIVDGALIAVDGRAGTVTLES